MGFTVYDELISSFIHRSELAVLNKGSVTNTYHMERARCPSAQQVAAAATHQHRPCRPCGVVLSITAIVRCPSISRASYRKSKSFLARVDNISHSEKRVAMPHKGIYGLRASGNSMALGILPSPFPPPCPPPLPPLSGPSPRVLTAPPSPSYPTYTYTHVTRRPATPHPPAHTRARARTHAYTNARTHTPHARALLRCPAMLDPRPVSTSRAVDQTPP